MSLTYNEAGRKYDEAGLFDKAAECYEKAVVQEPDNVESWNNLGISHHRNGRLAKAFHYYRRAVKLDPYFAGGHANMAMIADQLGRPELAAEFYSHGAMLNPLCMAIWHDLAGVLMRLGRFDEAYNAYEHSIALESENSVCHSSKVYVRELDPRTTVSTALAEKLRWWKRHRYQPITHWDNDISDPQRKLRLGYVSADFRFHSAATIFANLIGNHDRERFDVTCYSMVRSGDELTSMFQGSADRWRHILGAPDLNVAQKIREDGIDILIDLSGFTDGHRLRMMTLHPAPIQVHAAGFIVGTGLPDMDYILLDDVIGKQDEYVEKIVKLPCAYHYRPYHKEKPAVMPVPALDRGGAITFGYYGRFEKVSDETVELWRELLAAIPNSRLILKDGRFDYRRQRTIAAKRFGVAPGSGRLGFLPRTGHFQHLDSHRHIDVLLDPLENQGGVSALDALWMGVPVLTTMGSRPSGRLCASIMGTLGLSQFVVSRNDYVGAAQRIAAVPSDLVDIRRGLRDRINSCSIGNSGIFVGAVEAAYRQMWVDFTRKQSASGRHDDGTSNHQSAG